MKKNDEVLIQKIYDEEVEWDYDSEYGDSVNELSIKRAIKRALHESDKRRKG